MTGTASQQGGRRVLLHMECESAESNSKLMTIAKMHEDEVGSDARLVTRLIATQFPMWANLPVIPIRSFGTDNAIYRLGDELVVRLPRIHWAVGQVEKEHKWLPQLAPLLPVEIPTPLAMGEPGRGYPWHWSVYRWLEGENLTIDRLADPNRTALELAQFIKALQQIDTANGPRAADSNSRGNPLSTRDAATREAIAALGSKIDTDAVTAVWETSLQAAGWDRPPVWFHGDLLPGNLLFVDGHLSGVIDFGGLGVGDPACDLMIAWGLFAGESRAVFHEALAVDEATWKRGRGHALSQALIFIPYYRDTNPAGVRNAWHAIDAVVEDYRVNG